jgi:hypothetical protein
MHRSKTVWTWFEKFMVTASIELVLVMVNPLTLPTLSSFPKLAY